MLLGGIVGLRTLSNSALTANNSNVVNDCDGSSKSFAQVFIYLYICIYIFILILKKDLSLCCYSM